MVNSTDLGTSDPLHDPAQFLALGQTLAAGKAGPLALSLVERALALHADDPLWQALAAMILRHEVHQYHFKMLRDQERNAAYRKAIERFAPGRRVLDIGTGSGLLAMMAARAGAKRVYACEANSMLAASARAVIARNGLSERITVFDRHSTRLRRDRDLEGGVDLVISEVFAESLVGEGVLASLAHARSELAAPGAIFLPGQASIEVALAEFAPISESIGPVEGFDVGAFAGHFHPKRHLEPDDPALILRSDQATMFTFDFGSRDPPQTDVRELRLISTGGVVSGLAQWLRLTFAEDIIYENRPGNTANLHWVVNLAPCQRQATSAGALFRAGAIYGKETLVVWCRADK